MKILTAKEMVLVQDYYFFTLDDFRPRRVGDDIKLRNNNIDLGYLRENGALFECKEDAIQASNAIRAFLAGNRMFLQSRRQHASLLDTPREKAAQKQRNLLEETVAYKEGHTQLEDDGQMHSEPHFPRTVLIKILHS